MAAQDTIRILRTERDSLYALVRALASQLTTDQLLAMYLQAVEDGDEELISAFRDRVFDDAIKRAASKDSERMTRA